MSKIKDAVCALQRGEPFSHMWGQALLEETSDRLDAIEARLPAAAPLPSEYTTQLDTLINLCNRMVEQGDFANESWKKAYESHSPAVVAPPANHRPPLPSEEGKGLPGVECWKADSGSFSHVRGFEWQTEGRWFSLADLKSFRDAIDSKWKELRDAATKPLRDDIEQLRTYQKSESEKFVRLIELCRGIQAAQIREFLESIGESPLLQSPPAEKPFWVEGQRFNIKNASDNRCWFVKNGKVMYEIGDGELQESGAHKSIADLEANIRSGELVPVSPPPPEAEKPASGAVFNVTYEMGHVVIGFGDYAVEIVSGSVFHRQPDLLSEKLNTAVAAEVRRAKAEALESMQDWEQKKRGKNPTFDELSRRIAELKAGGE